ncbi:MAG: GNAT family N-acetyltransferase [bacterium]
MTTINNPALKVRNLEKSDAYQIGLLTDRIYSEMGSEPIYSVETTIRLFETPWLQDGAGLVLEEDKRIVGYGWARYLSWHCRNVIHIGLFLAPEVRQEEKYQMLTDELFQIARHLAHRFKTSEALMFYRSIDFVHPPIITKFGFRQHPVSMLGFRHDLESLDEIRPPEGVVIRPARLPAEIKLIDDLGNEAFDDPLNQGEHINEAHLQIEIGNPGFQNDQFIIAQHKSRPVGYLVICSSANTGADKNYDIAEFGVIPSRRRKGIGTALLLSALKWIKKVNAKSAFIAGFSSNPAVSLYWRLKFRPDPLRTYNFFTKPI